MEEGGGITPEAVEGAGPIAEHLRQQRIGVVEGVSFRELQEELKESREEEENEFTQGRGGGEREDIEEGVNIILLLEILLRVVEILLMLKKNEKDRRNN